MDKLLLASTYKLLRDSFGDELPNEYFEPVIILMSEGLCEENLIKAVGSFHNIGEGKFDIETLNFLDSCNIEKVKQTKAYIEAFSMLKNNGYLEWLEDED